MKTPKYSFSTLLIVIVLVVASGVASATEKSISTSIVQAKLTRSLVCVAAEEVMLTAESTSSTVPFPRRESVVAGFAGSPWSFC